MYNATYSRKLALALVEKGRPFKPHEPKRDPSLRMGSIRKGKEMGLFSLNADSNLEAVFKQIREQSTLDSNGCLRLPRMISIIITGEEAIRDWNAYLTLRLKNSQDQIEVNGQVSRPIQSVMPLLEREIKITAALTSKPPEAPVIPPVEQPSAVMAPTPERVSSELPESLKLVEPPVPEVTAAPPPKMNGHLYADPSLRDAEALKEMVRRLGRDQVQSLLNLVS